MYLQGICSVLRRLKIVLDAQMYILSEKGEIKEGQQFWGASGASFGE